MNELKKLAYCIHGGCNKVTVLCLFSKNKDTLEVLDIISNSLKNINEKLKIPAECYPLGNVDHFRLLKGEELYQQMEEVKSEVFKWHGESDMTCD
jgi:hypothetical protein